MASSSNPSPLNFTHDVFVSYMHADTGNSFTSHLKSAFGKEGFSVAMNDTVDKGEEISDTVLGNISESLVCVVVFSKSYATCAQCLDELVKIWESKEEDGGRVLPVFLGVEPTHVRNQTGAFGDGFQRLIESSKQFKEKEETWKSALTKTANLSGWDSTVNISEAEIVDAVLECIKKTLDQLPSENSSNDFMGIYQMEAAKSLLQLQFKTNVQFLGIWGMGGIGKTRISTELFHRISSLFDASCFLENIRETLKRKGLQSLVEKMFLKLGIHFKPSLLASAQRALNRKRVLIILDDVSNSPQLKSFVKNLPYGSGSRIILTCRDKQVLTNYQCEVYEVKILDDCESLKLFELNAFTKQTFRGMYKRLVHKAVSYCGGLPLALVLLGCHLCDKNFEEWKSELAKLKNIPNLDVNAVMEISYEGLDEYNKSIFLDIACMFCGWDETAAKRILHAHYPDSGIRCLTDRALITNSNGELRMHDLIRQFGQHIVFSETKEPGNRSRIWRFEDFSHMVARNTGSEKVEVISVNLNEGRRIMYMKPHFFEKMDQLRVLNLRFSEKMDQWRVLDLPDGLSSLPSKLLSYLRWDNSPLTSFPWEFSRANHLVELRLSCSHLKQLWSEGAEPHLPLLECLDLNCSFDLIKLPNLSKCLNLKTLDVSACRALVEVPSSIQHLSKLHTLNMQFCVNLAKLPVLPQSIVSLMLVRTKIEELPSWIGSLSQLPTLSLSYCSNLTSLPESLGSLQSLKSLRMNHSGVRNVPSSIGQLDKGLGLVSLEEMILSCTSIESLPATILHLSQLKVLRLRGCKNLKSLPELPSSLESLYATGCTSLRIEGNIFGLSLSKIYLGRTGVESLPASIKHLPRLKELHLEECKILKSLPDLPSNLEVLDANGCMSLTTVGNTFREYDGRSFKLNMGGCFNLDQNSRNICLAIAQAMLNADASKTLLSDLYVKDWALLPGSEVPNWFKYKGEGSSIEVEPLGGVLLEHLNKAAFCIIIDDFSNLMERSSDPLRLEVRCKCKLVTEFGEHCHHSSSGIVYNHGKHVFLWVSPVGVSFSSNQIIQGFSSPPMMCSKAKIEFEAHYLLSSSLPKSKCKIMHCGVSFSRKWERDAKANTRKRKAETKYGEKGTESQKIVRPKTWHLDYVWN